ncbi:hypothetical protein JCM10450v2_001452 [Rhodotorula kratochvilovae]
MSGFSASSAFKQAKAMADKGHAQISQQFNKVDQRFPIGTQKRTDSSSSVPLSPGLATHTPSAPPPPPPTRSSGPPPPPGRARAGSAASTSFGAPAASAAAGVGAKGVFSGMDQREKEAFFALLDEYFSTRPQFAALFQGANAPSSSAATFAAAAPPAPPAASRPTPTPPAPAAIGTAVALYAFEGAEATDLSFAEGERISVLEVVSDDWLKGELNGRTGMFPSAYVQMQG